MKRGTQLERINPRPPPPAARFVSAVDSWKESVGSDSLVLFSGDAFNPSLMSTVTKGRQMVPILNRAKVDVACMVRERRQTQQTTDTQYLRFRALTQTPPLLAAGEPRL